MRSGLQTSRVALVQTSRNDAGAPRIVPAEGGALHCAVEVREGREAFASAQKAWNGVLAEGPRRDPFFRHEYQRIWLENFAPSASPLTYLVRAGGRVRLAAALVPQQGRVLGVPVRMLTLPANDHSNRSGFALGEGDAAPALAALWQRVREATWDVLLLRDLPEGAPELSVISKLAADDGHPTGTWCSQRSPYVALEEFSQGSGTAAERVFAKLPAHFRANLRRRRKKLSTHGAVEFERADGSRDLEALLEEAFRLEASGWKGRGKTAIATAPQTVGFYSALARWAAREKMLSLSFLKVGATRVAFHFGLMSDRKYYILKCGFDEATSDCSPGQQLLGDVLTDCVDRNLLELDFLGPSMPWKLDWTSTVRAHRWLTIFRPTPMGRALCAAKFTVAPLVKGWTRGHARVER